MQQKIEEVLENNKHMFSDIAEQWAAATGERLLLLSPQGQPVLQPSSSVPPDLTVDTSGNLRLFPNGGGKALVPVLVENKRVGYLFTLKHKPEFSPILDWLAKKFGTDLENEISLQSMTDELIASWNQLDLVYRITQIMAEKSNLQDALHSVLSEVTSVVKVETAFVLLRHHDGRVECVTAGKRLPPELQCPQLFLDNFIKTERLVVINNQVELHKIWEDAPDALDSFAGTFIATSHTTASLGLINKRAPIFTAGDVKLMTAITEQLGAIIDNFTLQQELILQERVGRELEIAAEIQQSLLPKSVPNVKGVTIDVNSTPAYEVGGDFYDFAQTDDSHLTIAVGDVAGKGIPAAMFTSMVRTLLRVETFHNQEPHIVLRRVNEILYPDLSQAELFVTVFLATYSTKNNVLMYANAGHVPGIVYHAQSKTSRLLKATSLPIGIVAEDFRTTQYVHLSAGDTLVLYSDGVTEAKNPEGERFGLQRVQQLIHRHAEKPPKLLKEIILREVLAFQSTELPADDVTLVVVKFSNQVVRPEPHPAWEIMQVVPFEYQADTEYLNEISEKVTTACRTLTNLPAGAGGDDFIYLIELAVSEICTNMIEHSYADRKGTINGNITLATGGVQIDVYDHGRSFNPNAVPPPMSDPMDPTEGGYGLHIVRQIMDIAEYKPQTEKGNHWRLIKYIPD